MLGLNLNHGSERGPWRLPDYICIAYVASNSLDEQIKTQLELFRLLMIMIPYDYKQTFAAMIGLLSGQLTGGVLT